MAKIDGSGTVLSAQNIEKAFGQSVATEPSGGIAITGEIYLTPVTFGSTTLTTNGFYDMFVFRIAGTSADLPATGRQLSFSIYPNPSSGSFNVAVPDGSGLQLDIHSLSGAKCYSQALQKGVRTVRVELSPGLYFVTLSQGETLATKRLLVK
jgi:hypothetical protein